MAENPQGHNSSGALSPLPGKKVKTPIRCDRLIAARRGCFGKQDRLCLSDEKWEEDRRGGSEGGDKKEGPAN